MLAKLLPGLAGPGLFLLAGAGLQALLPRPLERPLAARLGYAYLLGVAWCALTLWIASFALRLPVGAISAATLAALPAAAAIVRALVTRRPPALRRSPRSVVRRRFDRAAIVVAVAVAAASLALLADASAQPVTDFDGRMTWGTIARYVASEGTVLPVVLRDEASYLIHPRYPLVMPLAQVVAAGAAGGGFGGFAVRPLYALFLPALAAALWPALRRVGGAAGAALAMLLLLAAPILLWDIQVGPRGTFSDFPLAAFLGAGGAVLLHPRARRERWRGLVAGLLLAAAAGAKNEGLLLAPALLLATAWVGPAALRRGALRRAAVVVALGVLLVVAWRTKVPNRNDEGYFEHASATAIARGFAGRAPLIASRIASIVFDRASWGEAFWLLPVVALAGRRGLRGRGARLAFLWLGLETAMAVAAYSVVGRIAIIEVTWNRFLVQLIFPLLVLIAAAGGALTVALPRRRRAPAGATAPQKALVSSPPQ